MENKAGAKMERLTESTTENFNAYSWREPQIINFTARDGAKVPARLYRPENARYGGPAVIFVHGAGLPAERPPLVEQLLPGIHVPQPAGGQWLYRAGYRLPGQRRLQCNWRHLSTATWAAKTWTTRWTAPNTWLKNWCRSAAHRHLRRIYGGFITLMAFLPRPAPSQAGAALRSVTDWAHYNHGYTSDILNTPVEDSLVLPPQFAHLFR